MFPLAVHYNDKSMANILSMKVASIPGVTVTIDISKERALLVELKDRNFKFSECDDGLYYYDTLDSDKVRNDVTSYSLLQSAARNKKYFTNSEIKGAESSRTLQQEIGWPSTGQYKCIVAKNLIRNSGVTVDDINRAEIIFGTPETLLKGKMIRRVRITKKIEKIPLPIPISERHK